MRYVVTAPYVVLKVPDPLAGGWTMRGFYAGTPVADDIDPDNLRHHLDGGMLAEVPEDGGSDEVLVQAKPDEAKNPLKAAKPKAE